jgi:trafficking protein particle complex subunit 8
MTPFSNVTPPEPSTAAASGETPLRYPQKRLPVDAQSLASSVSSLSYRRANNSVSSLFASTSTPPGSRSISPNGPLRGLAGSVFVTTPAEGILDSPNSGQAEDPRHLILQGYVPHIAIHTSADTDELTRDKGFTQGLWQLLRPFGERVQGKVTIRDSNGASRVCDDFTVRFVQLGDGLEKSNKPISVQRNTDSPTGGLNGDSVLREQLSLNISQPSRTGGDIDAIENLIEEHLSYAESISRHDAGNDMNLRSASKSTSLSPFYTLYLRRLLSGVPLAPHETFSHPVACIIAISSRNSSPIEALRHLYDDSSRGEKRLPPWVNSEYLRYYVLVHDEERDDISKSMTLFEQMKRHFGLHCHLLRLRSSQCVPSDDDSTRLPPNEWISASEELAEIEARDTEEYVENASPCIFESDATAIRTFIREMVTQSVVPHMERNVSTWNEQVASRRRGISGRITNIITKKWGFGGGSRSSSAPGTQGNAAGSNSNYDAVQGFYRPDAPEAIMRKLADYAFMLRDWKLAQSIYDLLRTDFSSDKAWEYHAATNEMAAISSLLLPQALTSKMRAETVDLMLDTALYSYTTRCNSFYGAIRSLLLGMELLRLRGGSSTDDAARWGTKLIENSLMGSVGEPLLRERIAVCYATREGAGSVGWGARTRKAALWNVLAADDWLNLGKYKQAEKHLSDASMLYDKLANRDSLSHFSAANAFLTGLHRELQAASFSRGDKGGQEVGEDDGSSSMDEESEALDLRSHRKSLIGTNAPPLASLETAPLRSLSTNEEVPTPRDDDFV